MSILRGPLIWWVLRFPPRRAANSQNGEPELTAENPKHHRAMIFLPWDRSHSVGSNCTILMVKAPLLPEKGKTPGACLGYVYLFLLPVARNQGHPRCKTWCNPQKWREAPNKAEALRLKDGCQRGVVRILLISCQATISCQARLGFPPRSTWGTGTPQMACFPEVQTAKTPKGSLQPVPQMDLHTGVGSDLELNSRSFMSYPRICGSVPFGGC